MTTHAFLKDVSHCAKLFCQPRKTWVISPTMKDINEIPEGDEGDTERQRWQK